MPRTSNYGSARTRSAVRSTKHLGGSIVSGWALRNRKQFQTRNHSLLLSYRCTSQKGGWGQCFPGRVRCCQSHEWLSTGGAERKLNTPSTIWWLSWYRCQLARLFILPAGKIGSYGLTMRRVGAAVFEREHADILRKCYHIGKGKESTHRRRKGSNLNCAIFGENSLNLLRPRALHILTKFWRLFSNSLVCFEEALSAETVSIPAHKNPKIAPIPPTPSSLIFEFFSVWISLFCE